ncbi:TBCC domain-containing protein 1-like isoform X2 [Protopterus annectens]|uniref:TBCC domain-containing protein 1-like isoform X2 n=1 Tax=Protopterus annectens TaxID=7888 RepID=UPI001CFBB21C|nr:TBCC domain-containing protein 1-like isoform X2 [Protopterus annectens]
MTILLQDLTENGNFYKRAKMMPLHIGLPNLIIHVTKCLAHHSLTLWQAALSPLLLFYSFFQTVWNCITTVLCRWMLHAEMESSDVNLWVKSEPFIVGALPIPPPSKFSMYYLRKIAAYVRTRADDGCYPKLFWPMWRHIACGKLQLAEDLAWLYFETFDSLVERTAQERLEWAEAMSICTSNDEMEKLKNKISIDTLQFLLFLYIQQLNKVSLRTSLIGEEWPSPRARSPSSDLDRKYNSQNKNWDDQTHLAFVQNHLLDLLELLLDPEQLTASSHTIHNSPLSPEAVKSLDFLIEGTVDKNRSVHSLYSLAIWQPMWAKSGYSKLSNMFSFSVLHSWLKNTLSLNPFGTSACLKFGRKLAWVQQVEGTPKRVKIACNTDKAPETHKLVIMTQVCKQIVAKSSDELVGAHVKIHRCSDSSIYLLSPLRSVTVDKCRNSTFVLGPVQTSVHIHNSDNVKVIVVCHRLTVSSSTVCTFHTLTHTRPVILTGNESLTFAPFNTHYATLEDHMAWTGLATVPNYWNHPVSLGVENSAEELFHLLAPGEFHIFIVPFEMKGDTTEIPGGLPLPYEKAVCHQKQKLEMWQKMVKETGLAKEQKYYFQKLVEKEFHQWLIETGHRHELHNLILIAASSKETAG